MNDNKELGEIKVLFLKILNQKVKGNFASKFRFAEIGQELGLDSEEIGRVVSYLSNKGFITLNFDGTAQINAEGIDVIENNPQLSGKNLQQVTQNIKNNFENSGQIYNSQIMQGGSGNSQNLRFINTNMNELKKFIELFENKLDELPFYSEDDKNEAIAEIQTIKTQLNSPKPKEVVIYESRKTLRNILEGMTGSILATELLKLLLGS